MDLVLGKFEDRVKWVRQVVLAQLGFYQELGVVSQQTATLATNSERRVRFPPASEVTGAVMERLDPLRFSQGFDYLWIIPDVGYQETEAKLLSSLAGRESWSRDKTGELLHLAEAPWCLHKFESWDDPGDPLQYDLDGKWVTRKEFYSHQPFPGFHVFLTRSRDLRLPKWEKGRTIAGRTDVTGGYTVKQYEELLLTRPYQGERWMNVDDWMWYVIITVELHDIMPDVWNEYEGCRFYPLGNRFACSNHVAMACFHNAVPTTTPGQRRGRIEMYKVPSDHSVYPGVSADHCCIDRAPRSILSITSK